ncbi:MAG: hypothetical protein AB4058_01965 [Microcystaceae cyanobacterium]
MKNFLTFLALSISLSGIAASVLREEMRCYLGLASQSCPTSEKPTPPVSLPQKSPLEDLEPTKSTTQPKVIEPSPEKPIISEPEQPVASPNPLETPAQPIETVQRLNPNTPLRELPVPVEALRKRDLETSNTPAIEPTETGIPLSVEPYESTPE